MTPATAETRQPGACCWVGSARYSTPLDTTANAKWALLARLERPLFVVSFAADRRARRWLQHACFYLLPNLRSPWLRSALYAVAVPPLLVWLGRRRHVEAFIAQSPFEGALAAIARGLLGLVGRGPALIVESHGDFDIPLQLYDRRLFGAAASRVRRRIARWAIRRADAFRAISRSTEAQLRSIAPDRPIERFITWTDVEAFRGRPRRVPLASASTIVYAGVLVPGKGVHLLVDAFVRVAPKIGHAVLAIAGAPQNPEYAERLREAVTSAGLSERVRWLGALGQHELAALFATARVLVLPSYSEGLGRVILEAMLCAVPAIGTRIGGIPDLIADGETGYLIDPGDTGALANALLVAFSDPDIEAMGERARTFAERFFSPADYLEGYRRLLAAAVEGAVPARVASER
jgi:glycosyltransferase involved in cell wall biosynthesis